ncbi:tRNA lysidine(34) synthetase TilS [Hydrogenophaga sp.]|uniref:tRNA lysidine(34) synthetase TilS n=1 Tax=Hydrogenophaga sp. TaxID=1904254 RepID=UPI00262095AC|nr:tRNA lysidine(34) synthetase TilS [Hydrogenophaga sp.]MDM7949923.1 tRNA lysidine(34) synthetase TilS [Hydrogenophaga sp.]
MDRWCERHAASAPPGPVAVAFSAGADSTALLLAAHQRWPGHVIGLHVHHGLQAAADAFEAQARVAGQQLGLPIEVRRVDARAQPGQSPEDAARQARYRELASMAKAGKVSWVLLGHHADDQAETLMLALSRGAGLPGLAAMGEVFEREGVAFGRPLLSVRAAELRDALQATGQTFLDDPTNADPRFTRNRIRAELLPAWAACFPGFETQLARSARHAAQAQRLLDELAELDLARTGQPPAIAALQTLSRDRQGNALRRWLRQSANAAPSAAQLDELLDQIADCRTRGHRIQIKAAHGMVSRLGERLHFAPPI